MTHQNHDVKTRTNAQTSRKGWRPRQTSHTQLVRDIVASIQAKHAAGKSAAIGDYTNNPVTTALVEVELNLGQTLRPTQPDDDQERRRQQQADADRGKSEPPPSWVRPCDDCQEPTTHGLLCSECEDMRWSAYYDEAAEYHEYHAHFYC